MDGCGIAAVVGAGRAGRKRGLRVWLPRSVERAGSAAEECLYQMEVVNGVVMWDAVRGGV